MAAVPQAAGAPPADRDAYLMQKFQAIAQRYEISDYFCRKLRQLEGFEIVLICDDSGSMATPLAQQGGAFAKSVSRWEELKNTVGVIIDIAAVMDKDGVDVYFLNRATVLNVTSSEQIAPVFASPPAGLTPTNPVLQHVLQAKKAISQEKKVLIVILTDGQPTNAQGEVDIPGLKATMTTGRDANRFYVTFVACTDDDSSLEYMNKWDKEMTHVDVVDDYVSERNEIRRAKGQQFQFSQGDYVVKSLLGSIDPEFDRMDDKGAGGCCTVQ